jgi:hemolysin activation/secretion protein/predicted porin
MRISSHRPPSRPSILAAMLALAGAGAGVQAQPAPDAGRLLEQLRERPAAPQPAPPAGPRVEEERTPPAPAGDVVVHVTGFDFSGNTQIPTQELAAQLADLAGRELRYAELAQAAARITRLYRARGYLVARAVLPPQDIRDGRVRIEVREGLLGQVKVQRGRNLRLDPARIDGFLASLQPGMVLREDALENALLLLSDLPGVVVRSVLRPGAVPGTADLIVQVNENAGVQAQVSADNHGSRYTGRNRLVLDLSLNDMMGWGEALSLRSLTTVEGLTANTVSASIPVGSSGLRAGVSYTALTYDVGREFTELNANGQAEATALTLSYPLLRSRDANMGLHVAYERKHFVDRVGATTSDVPKHSDRHTIGLAGDWRDSLGGGGFTSYSLAFSRGRLSRGDAADAAVDAVSARTAGDFRKTEWSLARVQTLPWGLHLHASLQGQQAGKNLDSSEEFYLGGAHGVRGYGQGEGAGDEGMLARLELRRHLGHKGGFNVEGMLFYDVGRIRVDHEPWDPTQASNTRTLRAAGLGLVFTRPNLQWSMSVAAPVGSTPAGVRRSGPMVWLQATATPQFLNTRRISTDQGDSNEGDAFDLYGSLGLQVERVSRSGATPAGPRGATQSATPTGRDLGPYMRWSDPSSYVGARGALSLGGRLQAWWQAEMGVSYDHADKGGDSGAPDGGASTSLRDTAVGLRDPAWGNVFYGHWAMPLRSVTSAFDPFDDDGPGAASNFMGSPGFGVGGANSAGPLTTSSNSNNDDAAFVRRQRGVLQYWTPVWNGLSARVAYSNNRRHAAPDVGEGSIWGASVSWRQGPLHAMLGYERHINYFGITSLGRNNRGVGSSTAVTAGTSSDDHAARIGVSYDFGNTVVSAMVDRLSYSEDGVIPGNTVPDLQSYTRVATWIGVSHTIGRLELRASAGRARPGSCTTISNDPALRNCSTEGLGAHAYALGFAYRLTGKLTLFGHYARIKNEPSASYNFRVGGVFAASGRSPGVGADPSAFGFGFKYRF